MSEQEPYVKRPFRDETESFQRGHRIGYAKGYAAKTRHKAWPEHRPPHAPHDLVAKLFERGQAMRDAIDGYIANLEEDDELQDELGNPLDAWDEVMQEISAWLVSKDLGKAKEKTASTAAPCVRPPEGEQEGRHGQG